MSRLILIVFVFAFVVAVSFWLGKFMEEKRPVTLASPPMPFSSASPASQDFCKSNP